MKAWFKYKYGYVNLNDETLFLTNSGNWKEAEKLEEKSPTSIHKSNLRRYRMFFFLGVVFVIIAAGLLLSISAETAGILILVKASLGGYYVYREFSTELGHRFKIPYSKIKSVVFSEGLVDITFLDLEGNISSIQLEEINDKGLSLVTELKEGLGR